MHSIQDFVIRDRTFLGLDQITPVTDVQGPLDTGKNLASAKRCLVPAQRRALEPSELMQFRQMIKNTDECGVIPSITSRVLHTLILLPETSFITYRSQGQPSETHPKHRDWEYRFSRNITTPTVAGTSRAIPA